jgi:hypothetical protein
VAKRNLARNGAPGTACWGPDPEAGATLGIIPGLAKG